MVKILAFAGSTRKESINGKLIKIAADIAAEKGAEVRLIDLAEYEMPLFNADLENELGIPESTSRLKKIFIEHQGLLIASPEYNSSITPLMKNTLDWLSRRETEEEPPMAAYKGKVAAIMSASPGRLGGLRGLVILRMLLSNLGVLVLPEQQAVPGADNAFSEDGRLTDDNMQNSITGLVAKLINTVDHLSNNQT